eukprot:1160628-Pelagomonas_calceolata.AAC.13
MHAFELKVFTCLVGLLSNNSYGNKSTNAFQHVQPTDEGNGSKLIPLAVILTYGSLSPVRDSCATDIALLLHLARMQAPKMMDGPACCMQRLSHKPEISIPASKLQCNTNIAIPSAQGSPTSKLGEPMA